jgi:CheY-like chemotaxis protein
VGRPFRHEADTRQLSFAVTVEAGINGTLFTDSKRLQQILKNLLSNAFKFTERGGVGLRVFPAKGGWNPENRVLNEAANVIGFEVSDTGIGIPADKQKLIFEAFQQADASTSRRYGGTGLGLAISRELATLLGGEIQVHSVAGTGSTFTLYLTQRFSGASTSLVKTDPGAPQFKSATVPVRTAEPIADDRMLINPGDNILLIVEDDPGYAHIVMDVARDRGFKTILATTGAEAIELASQYQPTAITLDIFLPDMLGWGVLSHLKKNPLTRHIPVQIVSLDEDRQHGLAKGAFSFLTKPASSSDLDTALARLQHCATARQKRLLVVEDNPAEQLSIKVLLQHDDIEVATAATGSAALDKLAAEPWDCMVLDLKLPDMSGFDVLEHVARDENLSDLPVVVFTGRPLSPEEEDRLRSIARSIVVKGVESPERLFDETSLFMHRVVGDLPPRQRDMIYRLHDSNEDLLGRTVLVVDDDARNIFALSSVLERSGMKVLTASNGGDALKIVDETPDLAIILMDIMMPEMDGYEVIETIRDRPELRRLPIIALTAKAMKGDREKCLEAGASDYLAKPVDTDQLIAALRVWLHR